MVFGRINLSGSIDDNIANTFDGQTRRFYTNQPGPLRPCRLEALANVCRPTVLKILENVHSDQKRPGMGERGKFSP